MGTLLTMVDAAWPPPVWPASQVCACYGGGWDAAHIWTVAEIRAQPQRWRLPIWVAPPLVTIGASHSGMLDAREFIAWLRSVGAPRGCLVALDMETQIDLRYVSDFGRVMRAAGHRVVVYGSASTVTFNPVLDGYWWAAWNTLPAPVTLAPGLWGWQYRNKPGWDLSLVRLSWRMWDTRPPGLTLQARALSQARQLVALIAAHGAGWRAAAGRRGEQLAQLVTGRP